MKEIFQKVYCVNLDRRPERWQAFLQGIPQDWPFLPVERWPAVDGERCPPPEWWNPGKGAWGCYRSHLQIIEHCLNQNISSVLIFEDDAIFCDDFSTKARQFLQALPGDWQMVYLGGQHLYVNRQPPKKINDYVCKPYNVNRTHAFGLRGEGLKIVYRHITAVNWLSGQHIDHHLGRLHMNGGIKVYTPTSWLVGQRQGVSDIAGRNFEADRFWDAFPLAPPAESAEQPFVLVLGRHSSGTSCLAGILHHLGVFMGKEYTGYYGNNPDHPDHLCGFEDKELARICETIIPFPHTRIHPSREVIQRDLTNWIVQQKQEALRRGTIAGGKHPLLCRLADVFLDVCKDNLYVIACTRPLQESIVSLIRREGHRFDPERLEEHQRWLDEGRRYFLPKIDPSRLFFVSYSDMVENPKKVVLELCKFLPFKPTEEAVKRAMEWPDKRHRHIRLS